jgi:translocation protein SEC62
MASDATPSFYEDIDNLKKLCDFLRGKHGPPVREALLMEKRVHYMKGEFFEESPNISDKFVTTRRWEETSFSDFAYAILPYFGAGEKLVNFLVEPKKGTKWPTNLPKFASRSDAILVCKELCKQQFLLRSEKRGKGELDVRILRLAQPLCTSVDRCSNRGHPHVFS